VSFWQGVAAPGPRQGLDAGVERQLSDAVRRTGASGLVALAVRLSAAWPPAEPHHRRVARAVLEESVRRSGGQVFVLADGDLVLLGPAEALRAVGRAESLPEALDRLLGEIGAGAGAGLVSVWAMPEEQENLLAYVAARRAGGGPAEASGLEKLPGQLHRQTAVLLAPKGGRLLAPLFREIVATEAALRAQPGGDVLEPDPCLLRHLAQAMEARLLAALPGEAGRGGALDPATGPALHLNLSPAGVMGDGFASLAERCAATGAGLGVEIALVEAVADPAGLEAARRRLAARGIAFVLDAVSPHALRLTEPGALGARLVKLDWSATLPGRPSAEQQAMDAALARLGRDRVVLAGADSEAAVQWGVAHGLRRFQGRHIDAILAVSRMAACPGAASCTPRQCLERASATGPAGRAGCTNLALLDAGAPA
jgi:hypothetical protein